jgi:hypothetical protein
MKIVKVATTTKADFVEQNQPSIKKLIPDLTKLKHQGINYNACLSAGKKNLSTQLFFNTDEDRKNLYDSPSFKLFQAQLKASGPEASTAQKLFHLGDSSTNIFN